MLCSSRAVALLLAQTLDPGRDRKKGPTLTSLGIPSEEPVSPFRSFQKTVYCLECHSSLFLNFKLLCTKTSRLRMDTEPSMVLATDDEHAGTMEGNSGLQEQPEEKCSAPARSITVAFLAS